MIISAVSCKNMNQFLNVGFEIFVFQNRYTKENLNNWANFTENCMYFLIYWFSLSNISVEFIFFHSKTMKVPVSYGTFMLKPIIFN